MKGSVADILNALQDYTDYDVAKITMETRIKEDLGLDSLTIITMAEEAESRFDIRIPDDQLALLRTVGDLVNYVLKNE